LYPGNAMPPDISLDDATVAFTMTRYNYISQLRRCRNAIKETRLLSNRPTFP